MCATPGRTDDSQRHGPHIECIRSFPGSPDAIPEVRRMIAPLQLDAATAATAELLISELASNAVRHARTPFEVRVFAGPSGLHVEVVDGSTAPPILGDWGVEAERGRGLRIVDSLASAWGVEERAGNKAVWFELGSAPPLKATDPD
jgi:anti-sigma regulatory factor (Ser/Thr protein kinase)